MSKNLRGVVAPLTRALIASFGLELASFVLLSQGPLKMLLGLFCFACIVLKRRPIPDANPVRAEPLPLEARLTERFGFVMFCWRSWLSGWVRVSDGFGSAIRPKDNCAVGTGCFIGQTVAGGWMSFCQPWQESGKTMGFFP